jgi:hypothetical protein
MGKISGCGESDGTGTIDGGSRYHTKMVNHHVWKGEGSCYLVCCYIRWWVKERDLCDVLVGPFSK